MSEPAESPRATEGATPDASVLRRSALLGQRKSTRKTPDKPVTFTRKGASEAAPPPADTKPPARKKATRKTPEKSDPALEELRLRLDGLARELAGRPTWDDLQALETRLRSPGQTDEVDRLQALLRTRQEELDEMASLLEDLEEQAREGAERVRELEGKCEEDRVARGELERLLNSARRKLRQEEQQHERARQRVSQAEAFLREALLGLLSPGDEFNDELVEQIQSFLDLT